ncbi:hypothetical protein PVK06_035163 [Gossypium arboreum]|uniref:Uncharacterized protein n=1 Tax=Gossypium arboreum TaxID=29729 RepID=A0ABR0NG39_GOSAR|nr:hypothetical protein PVK06_035163 [Gossypium arboreum]
MRRLVKQIDRLIDEPNMMSNTKLLRTSHSELGRLYAKEESYWAQRSRIAWLKEEDKNTQFFHENWDVVGKDVLRFFHDVLECKRDIRDIKNTAVVLILKIKDTRDMFSLICLVTLKIAGIFMALGPKTPENRKSLFGDMLGIKEKGHGWAMLAWQMICLSMGMGDIGLRDLRLFNLALIDDKFDRLISYKDTLCFQVLSSKYFHNGDLFHLKKVDKPSFIWSSISAAARALEKGF